jgi:hypothetical protein
MQNLSPGGGFLNPSVSPRFVKMNVMNGDNHWQKGQYGGSGWGHLYGQVLKMWL